MGVDQRPVILRAQGISKSFQMGDAQIDVITRLDLSVREGEFLAIEGRSGSGKSTLLHLLSALEAVDEGELEFAGRRYGDPGSTAGLRRGLRVALISLGVLCGVLAALALILLVWFFLRPDSSPAALLATGGILAVGLLAMGITYLVWLALHWGRDSTPSRLRNIAFGFVFQSYHLLPELTVLENTLFPAMVGRSWLRYRLEHRELAARARAILEQLGLGHRLRHLPAQLSGGERQRVAIARALINAPKILFADEPTGNLDIETGKQIIGLLAGLHQRGQTIVMVTHDRALARAHADRVLILRHGKLHGEGHSDAAAAPTARLADEQE
jgi:ABC-type lipoprotein export system ATPase subunit